MCILSNKWTRKWNHLTCVQSMKINQFSVKLSQSQCFFYVWFGKDSFTESEPSRAEISFWNGFMRKKINFTYQKKTPWGLDFYPKQRKTIKMRFKSDSDIIWLRKTLSEFCVIIFNSWIAWWMRWQSQTFNAFYV